MTEYKNEIQDHERTQRPADRSPRPAPSPPRSTRAAPSSYFNARAGKERFAGQAPGFIYSRFGNPTTAELEQKLAALEGADEALVVASGMAAVSAIMYALADSGDEVAYIGPSTAAPMPSSSRPSAAPASRSPPTRAIRRCWPTSARHQGGTL